LPYANADFCFLNNRGSNFVMIGGKDLWFRGLLRNFVHSVRDHPYKAFAIFSHFFDTLPCFERLVCLLIGKHQPTFDHTQPIQFLNLDFDHIQKLWPNILTKVKHFWMPLKSLKISKQNLNLLVHLA
jgi:hypothetical protein